MILLNFYLPETVKNWTIKTSMSVPDPLVDQKTFHRVHTYEIISLLLTYVKKWGVYDMPHATYLKPEILRESGKWWNLSKMSSI